MRNAHGITKDFEQALCEYTGAPYAVAVDSCTMALTLAVAWCLYEKNWAGHWLANYARPAVSIPKRTYVSVPQAIIHAGGRPVFRDEDWLGLYDLDPLPVWDSARWFDRDMYNAHRGSFMCLSFHSSKILGDTQGGAILHDNPKADAWFRRARFDGRAEGVEPKHDKDIIVGWHCYMSPDVAARLLWRMASLPEHNDPLPNDEYPDLSELECFK